MPSPASKPPPGLPGLRTRWSRLVEAPDHRGVATTWHLLDTGASADVTVTLLCVHGNPSWAYLWRGLLETAPATIRVIAVDQLEMGWSERTGATRRLADRIEDLDRLVTALDVVGPVITVAHDWGGPISLGWALRHVDRLAGVVLCNTAVHQPADAAAPSLIRAVRRRGVHRASTVDTLAFVRGAAALSRPPLPRPIRDALAAPYASADRRQAIGEFVEDIPLDPDHPSRSTLDAIADGLDQLAAVPTLLLWGPRDPVFGDRYLHDLERRMQHAVVHRFAEASHFVPEDADVAGAVFDWISAEPLNVDRVEDERRAPLLHAVERRADDREIAVVELGQRRGQRTAETVTFAELASRITQAGAALARYRIGRGDRVALMIPPGIDLSVVLYGCWRIGAVPVLIDAGLGPRNMTRAIRSADPVALIGIPRAIVAARTLRWPGTRIAADAIANAAAVADAPMPEPPKPSEPAALVFTSGSTGPSKGVQYTHEQLQAQRDALTALFDITSADRLVAAFAPFALYGPALGIASVVPAMDVTEPRTLDAAALAEAVDAVEATLVFASPSAFQNVIETHEALSLPERRALSSVRLAMSAGAPVSDEVLLGIENVLERATAITPYGMTEVLPVSATTAEERRETTSAVGGVCVGRPVAGVDVMIDPLDRDGRPIDDPSDDPDRLGEIIVRAAHTKDGYDRLWWTDHTSSIPRGWHRTGDVGAVDSSGYLHVAGRLSHIIVTSDGPVAPVGIEHAAQRVSAVRLAAAVGVGPIGRQVVVVVVETDDRGGLFVELDSTDAIRQAVAEVFPGDIAAVLGVERLPTDRRHNAKIDRRRVAEWATTVLGGGRPGRL